MNASTINAHLEAGGMVQVTTYLKSWVYSAKHAGMFFDRNGSTFVRRGKSSDQLSIKDRFLVGIRFSTIPAIKLPS